MNKSEIIIGCMSWGRWGKNLSTLEQSQLINQCVENGNKTFDHADIYGDYTTEAEFGKSFRESGISRDRIKLISKCGIQLVNEDRKSKVKHYNYAKDYIMQSAEASLKNLGTEYLDTFLLHRPSPLMQVNEIAEAVTSLKESGKIREFGVSNFTPSQVDLLSKEIDISVNQIEFSLTQSQAMDDGTLDYMQLHNIEVLAWSPLGSVFKEENDKTDRIKKVLAELTFKYGVSEDTLLLSWILKHSAGISPVIGTTNIERIQNANKALGLDLELQDWFVLLEASIGRRVP